MEKSGFFTVSKFLKTFQQCLRKSREYLNTIKRYFGKVFIKFERVEDSFENSFGVRSIRIFTSFRAIPIINH